MTTEELVRAYGRAHYDYNAIGASRRRQQPKVLLAFSEQVGKPLVEVDGRDLRGYLATRLEDGIKPTTLGKELKMIRPFFAWLREEGHITADQLLDLREIKPPRGAYVAEPRPYSDKELARFWVDVAAAYPWTRRSEDGTLELALHWLDRWQRGHTPWKRVAPYAYRLQVEAVIALALYGGLRQDEIYRLDVDDMHYDNAYVLVRGARKNEDASERLRVVPWTTPAMQDAVRAWLDFREDLIARIGPAAHDRPWLTLRPKQHTLNRMTKRTFSLLICSAGDGWQYHRLRHTCATELLRAGYRLEHVQKILGHSNIAQTLRYAKLLPEDVLNEARRSERTYAGRMERLRAAA